MNAVISPSPLIGTVNAPPSKSYAHRLLICAMLAGGGKVCGVELSDDIRATLRCMSSLGSAYTVNDGVITVTSGIDRSIRSAVLDAGESGSTLRFFIPICLALGGDFVFKGKGRLLKRPLDSYRVVCENRGIEFLQTENSLTISGKLDGGCIALEGNASSQFISGMLLASPLMKNKPHIALIGEVESRPYIDITLSVLASYGVLVERRGCVYSLINGSVMPKVSPVEGDWSNAAYLYAYTFCGGNVRVNGLSENTLQGDSVCLKLFNKLAASREMIDVADCPDLFPALAAVAAINNGAEFTNTKRLSLKESDRALAMDRLLRQFGCITERYENGFVIEKSELHAPEKELSGYNDHRIVMALCILASVYGGTITEAEAVNKSFPNFFKVYETLGGKVELYDE